MKRHCDFLTTRLRAKLLLPIILCSSCEFACGQMSDPQVPQSAVIAVNKSINAEPAQAISGDAVPGRRPVIGIALEGGGALGLAHIGVLQWMQQHHIPVDRIAGTSMGALVGAMVASGHSLSEIEGITSGDSFENIFTLQPAFDHLSYRRRQDRNELPQAITLGLRSGRASLGNALVSDDALNLFLAAQFMSYTTATLNFDEMPIPFRCVATDLTTLRPMVFRSGSLPFAIRSSISVPGFFPPVRFNGHVLVDGAVLDNLPVDVLRGDLHAEVVIAVHLGDAPFQEKDAGSLLAVFSRAFQAATSTNEERSRGMADIQLLPLVDDFTPLSYDKSKELIKAGYAAAELQRNALLPYALNENDWQDYLDALESRRRSPPSIMNVVKVDGPSPSVSAILKRQADSLENRPFSPTRVSALISGVRGTGSLDAYYDTFQTTSPASPPGTNLLKPDDGLLLHWRRKWDGPPYLLVGSDIMAMNSNVSSAVLDLRFVDQDLGGYGSELRSDVRLGYLTDLGTEYYQPLGQSRFFVQPRVQFLREPVYLWKQQQRISERLLQRAGGGLDVGFTFNRNLQTSVDYQASAIRWILKVGEDNSPTPHLSGTSQSVAANVSFSDRVAAIASPHGTQINLRSGYQFHTDGSQSSPFLMLSARQTFTAARLNLISVSMDVSSYFRHNVADPFRFTLGGPLHLSASSIDEFRGTDTGLARAIYLRRVATLPTGRGEGIYITTGYEAGSVWSPETHSFIRQDGFGGVLLSTPFGAITLGGAVGDAGRRKVFFTFGRLF